MNSPQPGTVVAEPAFNLLDAPWLPVRWLDGHTSEVSLLDLFAHSSHIVGLAEPSPPAFVALHRLLLAITHRALTLHQGRWSDADRAGWFRQGLPLEAFEKYLEKWRDRFWLFHPTQPFMQVAALATAAETRDRLKTWMVISLASSKGDTPVLFDHCVESHAEPIMAGEALRHLLGYLQFAPPGLIQAIRVSDKAGPLANTLAVAPIGDNLGQSLTLGLHRFDLDGLDVPSWEMAPPELATIEARPSLPTGPNDRYTRQTRAALLVPMDGMFGPRVQHLHFAAGVALDEDQLDLDPMVPHIADEDKVMAVRFKEGRAFWRDMPSILPKSSAKTAVAPAIMSSALNVLDELGNDDGLTVVVGGTTSAQNKAAKLVLWRLESHRLPSSVLSGADVDVLLRDALAKAEQLHNRILGLLSRAFSTMVPKPDERTKRTREASWARAASGVKPNDDLSQALGRDRCTAVFFANAERGFPQLLRHVAAGNTGEAQAAWSATLHDAGRQAWAAAADLLGPSAAALRARALTEDAFHSLIRPLRPEPASTACRPAIASPKEASA